MISRLQKLERSFYERDALIVSKELVGKYIVKQIEGDLLVGEIVETEAYIGPHDRASHAFGNKKTNRTLVQYEERGHAYVYRIYGMYCCFCIVVGAPYVPAVTLIRAAEPIQGLDIMRKNRRLGGSAKKQELSNGPSKLCIAFDITHAVNGVDLVSGDLFLANGTNDNFVIDNSVRIGIDYAEDYKDMQWRFFKKDCTYVSRNKLK